MSAERSNSMTIHSGPGDERLRVIHMPQNRGPARTRHWGGYLLDGHHKPAGNLPRTDVKMLVPAPTTLW
jgi:hypothetical protein